MISKEKTAIAEAMLKTLVGLGWPAPSNVRYRVCPSCLFKNEFDTIICMCCSTTVDLQVMSDYSQALLDLYIAWVNANRAKILYEKTSERSSDSREK